LLINAIIQTRTHLLVTCITIHVTIPCNSQFLPFTGYYNINISDEEIDFEDVGSLEVA
jgi:hypothetical protein